MSEAAAYSGGLGRGLGRAASLLVGLIALAAIGTSLWRLEAATAGLEVERKWTGAIPVTIYRATAGGPAPVVLIAHGFAGSQQLMQPFAVTLARNGYISITFDFPGHGRNQAPFVSRIQDQDRRVGLLLGALESAAELAAGVPGGDGRLALLGHSMAGDVLVRFADAHREAVGATVAVSPYLAPDAPLAGLRNLLIVYGSLEPEMLHERGREAIAAATGSDVEAGVRYGDFDDGSARRLLIAEGAEHIGVLYSRLSLTAALDWMNRAFDRSGSGFVNDRGTELGLLFIGLLTLAWPLSRLLPRAATAPMGAGLGWRRLLPVALAPAILTPLLLRFLPTDYLPILLGDYLALHFGLYGGLTAAAAALARRDRRHEPMAGSEGRVRWLGLAAATLLASAYMTFAIAMPLDSYVTAYLPDSSRLWLLLAVVPGTWAYFVADGWLTRGPGAPRLAPILTKILFILSLLGAIALNLGELFFLIIIVPAILVFFLVFGLMGNWVYRRTWHPLVGALASGLAFAWAIAVTFPLVG